MYQKSTKQSSKQISRVNKRKIQRNTKNRQVSLSEEDKDDDNDDNVKATMNIDLVLTLFANILCVSTVR